VGAIATETAGGLALLLGLKARLAAVMLTGFLAFATLVFHTNLGDQQQLLHFLKNVAIIGGLVMVIAEGTGPFSLDGGDTPAAQERAQRSAPASTSA